MSAERLETAGTDRAVTTSRCQSGAEWVPRVEPWPEPVEGRVLLEALRSFLARLVVLPLWAAEALALWVLHTYAFLLRDVTAYIGIESPQKRCGKSTLLAVLSRLVERPVVSTNISPPAFFRVIEEAQPTLLIDEADTLLRGNEELRGILHAGYTPATAFVLRVAPEARSGENAGESGSAERAGESGTRLARFSCWCPKAFATIGRLPDTLADRCIVVRMQRKTADEECERLRSLGAVAERLRRQCARFVKDHEGEIAAARPELPRELNDREEDIWEPLLALADLAGGEWPGLARKAAVGLAASAQESSPIGSLLLDILMMFARGGGGRIFSRVLVGSLNLYVERPWMELRKGKQITEVWLARQLRPYGVRPKTIWIGDEQGKGYMEEDFRELYRRYIPRSELEALRAELKETREARARAAQERGAGESGAGGEPGGKAKSASSGSHPFAGEPGRDPK